MTVDTTTWLDYVTAFGSIATPILVIVLTALGWSLRRKIERQQELEDLLREDRIDTYNSVLEPFVIMFMSDAAWASDPKNRKRDKLEVGSQKMLSLEYRHAAFKMTLVAPDPVVKAHNEMMQYFYKMSKNPNSSDMAKAAGMVERLGQLLLEIRKSMGNQSTTLEAWDMMDWMMSESRKIKESRKTG